jgi:hypothetical protein
MAAAIDKLARQRKLRLALYALMVVGAVLVLSSCVPGPNTAAETSGDTAGCWLGLWHGIIFPIAFFISLFSHKVGVYEVANNGNWYDFGFFLGIVVIGGGGGVGARRARRRRD